ncbi:hypothetical protein HBI22_032340 [Parastagonospora nodorum]|nr:hypothetical protein HBI28_176020 [Parastagonospora nodorum]KAH5646028.1 hypothetical protein HBI22_032340 [Parastagonospora nodorum]
MAEPSGYSVQQRPTTSSPPDPVTMSPVASGVMSSVDIDASAQGPPLNNKRKRASMETKPLNKERSHIEGATAKRPPRNHDSATDRSIARPSKRLKTTDSSSAGDDKVEAQFGTQAEAAHEETPLIEESTEEERGDAAGESSEPEHADSAKPTKGKGKAVAPPKAKSKATDNSSDEGNEEEYLSAPKPTQAKTPKRKKAPRIPRPDAEVQAFLDGVPNVTNWTSTTGIHPDYCKIIEWLDKDKLEMKEIIALYRQLPKRMSDGDNPDKNIYKHYEKWAPKFYTEKNLVFVSRIDRRKYLAAEKAAGRVAPNPPKVKSSTAKSENNGGKGKKGSATFLPAQFHKSPTGAQAEQQLTASTNSQPQPAGLLTSMSLNQQLENLFTQVPPRTHLSASRNDGNGNTSNVNLFPKKKKKNQANPITTAATTAAQDSRLNGPSAEDVTRYFINRSSADVLYFKRSAGDSMLGHQSRPVLDLQCAMQYSEYLAECVQNDPELQLVEYNDSIKDVTIARYVACVAPSLRKDLPAYDLFEVRKGELRATEIQWSMQELKGLYEFARELRAWDVVDMVMDRMHAELHRPTPRILKNEDGHGKTFEILDFSPAFLEHLSKCDTQGTHFFTDILVMQGKAGWDHMYKYDMDLWTPAIKQMLIGKLLEVSLDPMVSVWDADFICAEYHHHHVHNWACYKEQDPAPPVAEAASDSDFNFVAGYWQRETELKAIAHQEAQVRTLQLIAPGRPLTEPEQISLSTASSTLKNLTNTRRKADKLLTTTEDRMPSASLTCFLEPEYIHYTPEDEYAAPTAAPEPEEQPAFPGGFVYPKNLGNTKKDNKKQQIGKMALVKRKLLDFRHAGVDVGDIGDIGNIRDMEMSDEGEDGEGDGSGDEDESSGDEEE